MNINAVVGLAMAHLVAASSDQNVPGGFVGRLLHFHGPTAYVVVGFLAFAEAALLVGFFIPGETAVVVGGVLAGLHQVNLEGMIVVVVVSAIVGDSVGFEIGKRAGPWLLDRRPMKGNLGVRRGLEMLEHYGGPAVFLGRFVAFARAVIPGLAGFSGLRYRTFFLYNAIGGVLWGVGYTMLGFVVGVSFVHILGEIGLWSLSIVVVVVAVFIVVKVVIRRWERQRLIATFAAEDERAEEKRAEEKRAENERAQNQRAEDGQVGGGRTARGGRPTDD